jgi:enterobactin synthetase component D
MEEAEPVYDGPRPEGFERFAKKRRLEFLAGRFCAARAIGFMDTGVKPDIGVNPDRSPRWPADVVGSITHTEGFVSAAVAKASAFRGIGIDSERIETGEPLEAIKKLTISEEERVTAAGAGLSDPEAHFLIFSAKESIYKCISPIIGAFIDFSAATIFEIDLGGRSFRFRLNKDLGAGFPAGYASGGRFEFRGPYVHTGIELSK